MNKTWNVFIEDVNRKRIVIYDIFRHGDFATDVASAKAKASSKTEFADELRRICQYYYWAKCEWEIILTAWPPYQAEQFNDEKVDVYNQLRLNWDVFVDYCWKD